MTPIDKAGIYTDISAKDYHADCTAFVSLSSTTAKTINAESCKHAWSRHPKLGAKKEDGEEEAPDPKATKAKEKGTLVHRLMLNKGGDIVVCPFDNWRKDVAKAQRDLAKERGQIPTLPHLMAEAVEAVTEARIQLDELGYDYVFRDGMKEVVIVWQEGETWFRAMIDNLHIDENSKTAEIFDLKTTGKSSHPESCANQIDKLSYDLSLEFYLRGLLALRPDLAGRVKRRWVFMETDAPYSVTPVHIDAEWELAAKSKCDRAIARWRECMQSGKWPHYVSELTRLNPKPWMIAAEFGNDFQ